MMKRIVVAAGLLFVTLAAGALEIQRNENPIHADPPRMIREIEHGRRGIVGAGEDAVLVVHVWGTPREMSYAAGRLLKEEIESCATSVLEKMKEEIGGDLTVLDQVYETAMPFIPPHFLEEMAGFAEGAELDPQTIIRLNLVGEASEWHCSLFGAWGAATASTGSLLQLRALDYAVRAGIQRHPVIMVYHPNEGHAFANFTWAGMAGSVTGMSSVPLAISEIGDDYDQANDSFAGVPFTFLLRDILQFDNSLEEALARVQKGPRTTSLMYAIGDGKKGEARALQTSRTLCNVYDPDTLEPLVPTHPRIKDIVYWGMSWNVPAFDKPLHDMLVKHYGNLTPEITLREILPTVGTGNLQVAIYDLTRQMAWLANAKADGETGPLNAYERAYIQLDMKQLFAVEAPKGR